MKREWDRNRSFVRIRFRRPTSAQLSRAVKVDEISVVGPTQPLRLARQSKNNKEARTSVPASFCLYKKNPANWLDFLTLKSLNIKEICHLDRLDERAVRNSIGK